MIFKNFIELEVLFLFIGKFFLKNSIMVSWLLAEPLPPYADHVLIISADPSLPMAVVSWFVNSPLVVLKSL